MSVYEPFPPTTLAELQQGCPDSAQIPSGLLKDKDAELKRKDVCLQHYSTKFFDDVGNKMLMKSLWEYVVL